MSPTQQSPSPKKGEAPRQHDKSSIDYAHSLLMNEKANDLGSSVGTTGTRKTNEKLNATKQFTRSKFLSNVSIANPSQCHPTSTRNSTISMAAAVAKGVLYVKGMPIAATPPVAAETGRPIDEHEKEEEAATPPVAPETGRPIDEHEKEEEAANPPVAPETGRQNDDHKKEEEDNESKNRDQTTTDTTIVAVDEDDDHDTPSFDHTEDDKDDDNGSIPNKCDENKKRRAISVSSTKDTTTKKGDGSNQNKPKIGRQAAPLSAAMGVARAALRPVDDDEVEGDDDDDQSSIAPPEHGDDNDNDSLSSSNGEINNKKRHASSVSVPSATTAATKKRKQTASNGNKDKSNNESNKRQRGDEVASSSIKRRLRSHTGKSKNPNYKETGSLSSSSPAASSLKSYSSASSTRGEAKRSVKTKKKVPSRITLGNNKKKVVSKGTNKQNMSNNDVTWASHLSEHPDFIEANNKNIDDISITGQFLPFTSIKDCVASIVESPHRLVMSLKEGEDGAQVIQVSHTCGRLVPENGDNEKNHQLLVHQGLHRRATAFVVNGSSMFEDVVRNVPSPLELSQNMDDPDAFFSLKPSDDHEYRGKASLILPSTLASTIASCPVYNPKSLLTVVGPELRAVMDSDPTEENKEFFWKVLSFFWAVANGLISHCNMDLATDLLVEDWSIAQHNKRDDMEEQRRRLCRTTTTDQTSAVVLTEDLKLKKKRREQFIKDLKEDIEKLLWKNRDSGRIPDFIRRLQGILQIAEGIVNQNTQGVSKIVFHHMQSYFKENEGKDEHKHKSENLKKYWRIICNIVDANGAPIVCGDEIPKPWGGNSPNAKALQRYIARLELDDYEPIKSRNLKRNK